MAKSASFKVRPAPRQAGRTGSGRKPIEHPFLEMGAPIVGKCINGRPMAAEYAFTVGPGVTFETLAQRFRRQLTATGKALRPSRPVRFRTAYEPVIGEPGHYVLLFWDQEAGK